VIVYVQRNNLDSTCAPVGCHEAKQLRFADVPLQAVTTPKQLRDGIVELFQGLQPCYITPEEIDEELAACGGHHGQVTTNLFALEAEVTLCISHGMYVAAQQNWKNFIGIVLVEAG
jgi:hypothetical protein